MRNVVVWLLFLVLLGVPSVLSYRLSSRAYHLEVEQRRTEEERKRVAATKEISVELQLAMKNAEDMLTAHLGKVTTLEEMRAAIEAHHVPMAETFALSPRESWSDDPKARLGEHGGWLTKTVTLGRGGGDFWHADGEDIVYAIKIGSGEAPDRAGYIWREASILRDGNALLAPQGFMLRRRLIDETPKPGAMPDIGRTLLGLSSPTDPGLFVVDPKLAFDVVPIDPNAVEATIRNRATHEYGERLRWVLVLDAGLIFLFWRSRRNKRLADLRTDFVASVSHELRTPLASVRMFSELLEAKAIPEDERAEVEHTLANEARRLHMTLERMLRFGALSRGRLDTQRKIQPLRPLLLAAAGRSGPHVAVACDEALEASVDEGLLGHALDNLLGNAAKYAPGPVVLRASLVDGSIVVEVTDRGPGIARRAQRRIFQPFERADDRLSKATQGTGVGLALVRGIAKAHGGNATVTSELGAGATFTLRFPQAS